MSWPFFLKRPHIYSLELTTACNNHCPGCSNVFTHQKAPLLADQWEQILNKLTLGARVLKVTGGEPTLHPQFEQILEAIDRSGISFTLFTNARWYHPEHVISLLKHAQNCNGLLISLHGADAASHEAFTHSAGSFQQTCENIVRAAQAGLLIHTSTVLNAYNYDHVLEIAKFSRALGAQSAVFNRYLGPPQDGLDLDTVQLQGVVFDIEQLRNGDDWSGSFQIRYGNCIPQCFMSSGSSGCWAGVAYCTIDPWGRMRPCNHSPTVVGSLFEHTIEELWQSEAMQSWRSLLLPECTKCSQIEVCHGGCRAVAEMLPGGQDPLIDEPCTHVEITRLRLFSGSKPALVCDVQQESFGLALIRGQSILPVKDTACCILERLDGHHTLQEIQDDYGVQALELVGMLIHRGFAILDSKDT